MQSRILTLIFKKCDVRSLNPATSFVEALKEREQALESSQQTLVLPVFTSKNLSLSKVFSSIQPKTPIPTAEALALMSKCQKECESICEELHQNEFVVFGTKDRNSVPDILHEAADSLPYAGCFLQTLLLLDSSDLDSHDSFLALAGALQRLQVWHNSRVTVVKLGIELSPLADQLVGFLDCDVVDSIENVDLSREAMWSGPVAVIDDVADEGQIFRGFYFGCDNWKNLLRQKLSHPSSGHGGSSTKHQKPNTKPKDQSQEIAKHAVCGRCLEVLQAVDLTRLPMMLLDKWTLTIKSHRGRDGLFEQYLQSLHQDQMGLLTRLRLYPDRREIPKCSELNWINTAAWKEMIVNNFYNIHKHQEKDVLPSAPSYLYMILLPSSLSDSRPESPWQVTAKALLSPHEMNAQLVKLLEKKVVMSSPDISCEIPSSDSDADNSCFGRLPVIQADNVRLLQEVLDSDISKDEIEAVLGALHEKCESLKDYSMKPTSTTDSVNENASTETGLTLTSLPEYQVLQSWETKKRKLQSYPSTDSIPVSSPLPPIKTKDTFGFNIQEILQLRRPDGSLDLSLPAGASKKKSPVAPSLCRVDSQFDLKMSWPESKYLNYHDVYYYRGEDDMRLEKRYAKVRDKGYFDETRSSFVSPLKKKKTIRAPTNLSPVRRSPRKRPAALMSRSKSDVLTPSIAKKPSPNEVMFKQPSARPLGKSPRKRRLGFEQEASTPPVLSLARRLSLNATGSGSNTSGGTSEVSPFVRRSPRKHSFSFSSADTCGKSSESLQGKTYLTSTPILLNNRACSGTERRRLDLQPSSGGKVIPRQKLKSPSIFGSSPDTSSIDVSIDALSGSMSSGHAMSKSQRQQKPVQRAADLSSASATEVSSSSNFSDTLSQSARSEKAQKNAEKKPTLMKRSDRHKLKLQAIIVEALEAKGISKSDPIHAPCLKNLFNVSMVLLKTLPNSNNLKEEMKSVVNDQVQQIINLEKRRSGIAV